MKQFGILIYEGVQPMDVFGPWEVFPVSKNVLDMNINMCLVSQSASAIKCDGGITVHAHCGFDDTPCFDYFVIPGGKERYEASKNSAILQFIKKVSKQSQYLLSVCTGTFLLYGAGLLEGKNVTTYWRAMNELKALRSINIKEKRVVKSANIWIAGGISSGIDLAFELIKEIAGKEAAGKIQLLFEYFPEQFCYCDEGMIDSLPSYNNAVEDVHVLPDYIQSYISSNK